MLMYSSRVKSCVCILTAEILVEIEAVLFYTGNNAKFWELDILFALETTETKNFSFIF